MTQEEKKPEPKVPGFVDPEKWIKFLAKRGADRLAKRLLKKVGVPAPLAQPLLAKDMYDAGKFMKEQYDEKVRPGIECKKWVTAYTHLDYLVDNIGSDIAQVKDVDTTAIEYPSNSEGKNLIWFVESVYKNVKSSGLKSKDELIAPLDATLEVLRMYEDKPKLKGFAKLKGKFKTDYTTTIELPAAQAQNVHTMLSYVHDRARSVTDSYLAVLQMDGEETSFLTADDMNKAQQKNNKVYQKWKGIVKALRPKK